MQRKLVWLMMVLVLGLVAAVSAPAGGEAAVPAGLSAADWAQIKSQLPPPALVTELELAKLTASDPAADEWFSYSVSVSGDTAVVGAYGKDDDHGAAYIFVYSGESWSQQAKLTASDRMPTDWFGYAVAISGDTAVIGAIGDDDDGTESGAAYVFGRSGGSWTELAKLTASDPAPNDRFGHAVAVNGHTAIIGVPKDADNGAESGSAYIFVGDGANWTEQAKLTANDAAEGDLFGLAVSISGETAVVGAYGDDDDGVDSGSAYVFVRSGTNWSQQAKLTASDAIVQQTFGTSVAVSGDTAVIGAPLDDAGGIFSGAAYVFVRSGTSWSEQAKLTASGASPSAWFGRAVAISGDKIIVGAILEDTDSPHSSGAAYLFGRSGATWSQQAKLTASDAAALDQLGTAVAISGNTAIAGAPYAGEGGSASGSVYVFASPNPPISSYTVYLPLVVR
ncbi:MAG: FG-GAP repeat protein [Chloroflexi bacterium]|nr:FG-GAP repeat protein [Chloroflexota bacterium]